jgi:enoyl-CoA hydratase/carnithine racemase
MSQPDALVITQINGHVFAITINRAHVANALDPATYYALSLALDEYEANDDLWVCVLTGAGEKAFSAGRDLKQLALAEHFSEGEKRDEAHMWAATRRLTDRFDMVKPIIARLNGLALGGGLELALACDIILAADHCTLGLPEPRRGLIAMAGGVHRLPRQIPEKIAMGHLLTGRPMTAARAYQLGLINEVVPLAELDALVDTWVADMLLCAPLSLRATKQSVLQGKGLPLALAVGARYDWEERRKLSEDAREGPRAFAQRRAPIWTGT